MQRDAVLCAGHALGYPGSRLEVDLQQRRSVKVNRALSVTPQATDRTGGL
jgi:hypothetical protein